MIVESGSSKQIFIDEIQFFQPSALSIIYELLSIECNVTVSGLDMTYRLEPFGIVPMLLAKSQRVTKLTGVCHRCGEDGYFTQRLIEGKPAPFSGPTVVVGGLETYECRCHDCFEVG
jgi:thymidine kinase